MFNSSVLDVAIGVIFGFLAVSLITSAIVEAINSIFNLRSRSLLAGIRSLVNDPGFTSLALQLYQHAAMNPRGSIADPRKHKPAYVDNLQFATALLDITGLSAASATDAAQQPGPAAVAALQAALDASPASHANNSQINQLLSGIIQRSQGDIHLIRKEIGSWFDGAMDRVGGGFKRWTQLASFVIAFLVAIMFNVESIHLANLLWKRPAIVDQLTVPPSVAQAIPVATTSADPTAAQLAREKAAGDITVFLQGNLPIGWPSGHFLEVAVKDDKAAEKVDWPLFWSTPSGWALLPGWLITAIAALFGAPFWFDVLQGVVRLKGSGPSPAEKLSGRAASD